MDDIRALVVNDAALFRTALSRMLEEIPEVEVVGTAPNGRIALTRVGQLRPNLVVLDVEMPEMDGIETLRHLRRSAPEIDVVMVSAGPGAGGIVRALELGAFDGVVIDAGIETDAVRADLKRVLNALITCRSLRPAVRGAAERKGAERVSPSAPKAGSASKPVPPAPASCEIVAVGISTGGPRALGVMVPQLPAGLAAPMVVVQHMPSSFIGAMVETLGARSAVRVVEGAQGMRLEKGMVYVAPGGRQMKVAKVGGIGQLALTDDPPENHCKPAADYLFRSVAEVYGDRGLGVIMTGMGADGREGLRRMKERGARVIAQNEESCVVFGMPMEAIKAGLVDRILPLDDIASEIALLAGHASHS